MVPTGDKRAKTGGEALGAWVERSGRTMPDGTLTLAAARGLVPAVMRRYDEGQRAATESATPEQIKAAELRERARRLQDQAKALEGDQVTFGQVAETWIAGKRRTVKASTWRSWRSQLDVHLLPHLGHVPLAELDHAAIDAFVRDREQLPKRDEDGKPIEGERALSVTMVGALLVRARAILSFACRPTEAGGFGLAANPAKYVEGPRDDRPTDEQIFTPAEIVALAAALARGAHRDEEGIMRAGGQHAREDARLMRRADDARDAAAVLLGGFCGLRRGELVGLRWGDVSFTDARLQVVRSVDLGKIVKPKSGKGRAVPMPQQVADGLIALERARKAHAASLGIEPALGDDDPVLGTALGDLMDPSALLRRVKRAAKAIGLKPLGLHRLRHSYVTAAREAFSVDLVQRFAGHADQRTAARYAHARAGDDVSDRMSEHLARQIEQTAVKAT
ncbi:site-specific integrase [Svornostia abyssi]|uniref:Site-specific integrase n=1 Tax=Svornostia abyssi TaxID=2898438 RepID=A0ABY5PAR1_9ACTN|nr:site-specific integrase [Parviterribacteraceae bacterium J379]